MNKAEALLKQADYFDKLARITPPETHKQLVDRLRMTLKRVAAFVPSQYVAQQVFNQIVSAKQKNQLETNPYYKEAQRIFLQLEFLEQKLPDGAAEIGVKANAIPIIKRNMQVLMEGQNFGAYQHYTLLGVGETAPIDLDEEAQRGARKDLGF